MDARPGDRIAEEQAALRRLAARLAGFTELAGTAIVNAESQAAPAASRDPGDSHPAAAREPACVIG
jgi:hypothetical protein